MAGTPAFFGFSRPNGNSIFTGNASLFWPISGNGFDTAGSTEAIGQFLFESNGTLSNLGMYLGTNTYTTTITSRVNGGAGAQSASAASVTGHFTDGSNTDAVTAGQNAYVKLATSAGSHTVVIFSGEIEWKSSTGSSNPFCFSSSSYSGGVEYQTSSTSISAFAPIVGGAQNTAPQTVETNAANTKLRVSGTLSHIQTYILVNSRTVAWNINSRKSTTDQNGSISIPNDGTTGVIQDSSNTDSVSGGDIWKYHLSIGSGSGTAGILWMGIWLTTTNHQFDFGNGWDKNVSTISTSVPSFYSASGYGFSTITENNAKQYVGFNFSITNLRTVVSTNSASNTVTANLSINGSAGSQALSLTNATTGAFEDVSNTDTITAGQTLSFTHAAPNNSNWIITNFMATGDPGAAPHRKRRIYWSTGG